MTGPAVPSTPGQSCTCSDPTDLGRGVNRSCPHYFEHVAGSQASTLARQAEHIRELIKERNGAKSDTEAAYDLAEQYARKAGVDVSHDDVLRYVQAYWDHRGQQEKRMTDLETLRWDVWQLHRELEEAEPARIAATPTVHLVQQLVRRIEAIARFVPQRTKGAVLLSRPEPPGYQIEMFPTTEEQQ